MRVTLLRTISAMLLSLLAFVPALGLGLALGQWLPLTPIATIVSVLVAPYLGSWLKTDERASARAAFAGSVGSLAFVPTYLLLAFQTLTEPIVTAHYRCGQWLVGLIFIAPIATLLSVVLLVPMALLGSRATERGDRIVMWLAWGSVALGTVSVTFALVHAFRPSPEAYLAALPRVELTLGERTPLPRTLGNVKLEAYEGEKTVACRLRFGSDERDVVELDYVFGLSRSTKGCPRLRLALDADWVVLEGATERQEWRAVASILRVPKWHLSDLTLRDTRGKVAAPIELTSNSVLGWLVALTALLLARRTRGENRHARRLRLYGISISAVVLTQLQVVLAWAGGFI